MKGGYYILISPTNVANNFIKRSKEENISITPLKLQKLVYFLYMSYLVKTGDKLFTERFETWKYGPVLPSLYSEFMAYGQKPITTYGKDSLGKGYMVEEKGAFAECVNDVWETYKTCTGQALSELTHRPNTAWTKAKETMRPYLDDEDIINEFTLR